MELNRKVSHSGGNLVINPEGGIAYKERDDKALFLVASSFKLRNSFYWNAEETLKSLESLIDSNEDFTYKMALAKFLSSMLGIRLSPVIITTREAMKIKLDKANLKGLTRDVAIKQLTSAVKDIFDRPDKIANALAYAQYYWGEFRSLPPFYKKALRRSLEKFGAYTLRKFRLRRRVVKMADMIKALRPRPANKKMSELYKAIIENRSEASIEKGTVITEVLSDDKMTKKEKTEWVDKNIDKIPFNALIRNLRNVPDSDENVAIFERRLNRALRIENGLPVVKVANPFSLLNVGLNCGSSKFLNVIDSALDKYLSNIELVSNGMKVSILIDVSGSMNSGIKIAADYMALLFPALRDADVKLYAFNMSLSNKTKHVALYKTLRPVALRKMFLNDFVVRGGTALADSVHKVSRRNESDLMIVISDEVSWADRASNRIFDIGVPVLAINPYPQGRFTAFAPNIPVVKISSIDAKIFYYIPLVSNFKKFKTWLKNWAYK